MLSRCLSRIKALDPENFEQFKDAPIIVGNKYIRDAINRRLVDRFAGETGQEIHEYHSVDKCGGKAVSPSSQHMLWNMSSSKMEMQGKLPLVPGMKVMIMTNLAINEKVVNGSEGILRQVHYRVDEQDRRYAVKAYVEVKGSTFQYEDLPPAWVPIFPEPDTYKIKLPVGDDETKTFSVNRTQLPIVPAYCYTDYKVQGRTMDRVIVDLQSARSLHGIYVMLSGVKGLKSVAVLRRFTAATISQRLPPQFRNEFARLARLDATTQMRFERGDVMSEEFGLP